MNLNLNLNFFSSLKKSDEPDAEQQCCNLSDEAEKADPTNPEVYQCKASIRISQTKTDEAKELINKSVDLWLGKGFFFLTIYRYWN